MSLEEFLKKYEHDADFIKKMNACTNAEDAYAVAKDGGLDIPFEKFKSFLEKYAETRIAMTEEELELVSGGWDNQRDGDIVGGVLIGALSLACV